MRDWADKWLTGAAISKTQIPKASREFDEAQAKHDAGHKEAAGALQQGTVDGLATASAVAMKSATQLWQAGEDESARTLRGAAQTLAAMAEEERKKL